MDPITLQGYDAFFDGKKRSTNPYDLWSTNYNNWEDGWNAAFNSMVRPIANPILDALKDDEENPQFAIIYNNNGIINAVGRSANGAYKLTTTMVEAVTLTKNQVVQIKNWAGDANWSRVTVVKVIQSK